jgi:thiol-disulfide isomerase/thioredoxin
MYKKSLSFWSLLLGFSFTLLVSKNTAAQSIPAFSMQLTNGKIFSVKDLPHARPVVIIYFSPDCEHCQALMNVLFKKISDFKKAEIVFVTFKPLQEVFEFEKEYKTASYPNIKVGIEIPVFFFRKYYDLENTPITALFDKRAKLIISYKKETSHDDLIKHFKVL